MVEMGEDAHDSESTVQQVKAEEEVHDIQAQIESAMRARVPYFKDQSDSLTFEGVRRVLEKDLDLEKFALDVHKRFVKEHLVECLEGAGDENTSKSSGEIDEKSPVEGEAKGNRSKKDAKETCSEDEDKMEDSPVMGLLTGHKTAKSETEETKSPEKKAPSETIIKSALRKRASYIKSNSEKITLAGLRRLLEEDLKLEKFTLDPFKKFISQQLDEVLESCVSEPETTVKKNVKKSSQKKASSKVRRDGNSGSSDSQSNEDEDEVKRKNKSVPKGKLQNSDRLKIRKRMAKETNSSGKKRNKTSETQENRSDAEDSEHVSDDDRSQSSTGKPVKKKEVPTPAYGKRVEHLRSVIKSCGMSVAPSVYKKVKQVPENKREAHLIKELEEILSKEGLSANPSEKEIKDVKKKKERAKELEGIDMSNIVTSSRRRSTTSFIPPPKPKAPVDSDSDDAEDTDDDKDEDDGKDEEVVEDEDNGNSDNNQSEEDEVDDSD